MPPFPDERAPAPPHSLISVPATDYATAWSSPWTDPQHGILTDNDLKLLAHVNCSYLSSGTPPTLLALKRHAQALTNLIRKLTVSSTFGIVGGNHEEFEHKFEENEAFDWLGNLEEPYRNLDPSHQLPLWAVANQVEAEGDEDGIETHCPLKKIKASSGEKSGKLQYASHQNLVMHANSCLEILDHEYAATGGLLSILPTEYQTDKRELEGARSSFLGQWLLHHQHMIARLHELELNYSNALDMIGGMHFQPGHISLHGNTNPDPQEQQRFVLVNAGQDVFDMIHEMMDRAEGLIHQKEKIWLESGVAGEETWFKSRGGKLYSKGVVPLDYVCRFLRLKGAGRGSRLYIMPAIQAHPGVDHTRAKEYPPKLVSVVAPKWADRVTSLEEKVETEMEAEREALEEGTNFRQVSELRDVLEAQETELNRTSKALAFYEARVRQDDREMVKELVNLVGEYESKLKRMEEMYPEQYRLCLEESEKTTGGLIARDGMSCAEPGNSFGQFF